MKNVWQWIKEFWDVTEVEYFNCKGKNRVNSATYLEGKIAATKNSVWDFYFYFYL